MSLDDIRNQIDFIDRDLLALLSQRADLVHEVGVIKNVMACRSTPQSENKPCWSD